MNKCLNDCELEEYESMDVCKSNEWMKELTKYINE